MPIQHSIHPPSERHRGLSSYYGMPERGPKTKDRHQLTMAAAACHLRRVAAAFACICTYLTFGLTDGDDDDPCQLYLAESTIPNSGLGIFAGKFFRNGEQVGRVGDAAFPTVDQDFHNSPESHRMEKVKGDYHWPFTNYDWDAPPVGCGNEANGIDVTVPGFGAAANSHPFLVNVDEEKASYDNAGLDRYTSPGAGAITPWFNRSSVAVQDIEAGYELFVDYGKEWFLMRDGVFELVPVKEHYEKAHLFLYKYGKLLVGSDNPNDLVEEKMALDEDARRDLWDIIRTFPYATRGREALPVNHEDAIRAIHGEVEKEKSVRTVQYLKEHGKCMDNIVPSKSNIPHAGRGAFATRFIPKGGLVAPAPLIHIADKSTTNIYNEKIGRQGHLVRDETEVINQQIIYNYMFGHPNSTVLLFPYSSNVAYINHHATEYNAKVRWAKDFSFFHKEEWLSKPVDFLEEQWSTGLLLEFIALRDIQVGEEVLINYGDEWQAAWDEHVQNWHPSNTESLQSVKYERAEAFNGDMTTPIRTMEEQIVDPYSSHINFFCIANVEHDSPYLFSPLTSPYFKREWEKDVDMPGDSKDAKHLPCKVTLRYEIEDDDDDEEEEEVNEDADQTPKHRFLYTIELNVEKNFEVKIFSENHVITDVPREAIIFKNLPYSDDIFLSKHAFRHVMKLPDDTFPKAWMNLIF